MAASPLRWRSNAECHRMRFERWPIVSTHNAACGGPLADPLGAEATGDGVLSTDMVCSLLQWIERKFDTT